MEDNLNFKVNLRPPQFVGKWKNTSICWQMEEKPQFFPNKVADMNPLCLLRNLNLLQKTLIFSWRNLFFYNIIPRPLLLWESHFFHKWSWRQEPPFVLLWNLNCLHDISFFNQFKTMLSIRKWNIFISWLKVTLWICGMTLSTGVDSVQCAHIGSEDPHRCEIHLYFASAEQTKVGHYFRY